MGLLRSYLLPAPYPQLDVSCCKPHAKETELPTENASRVVDSSRWLVCRHTYQLWRIPAVELHYT